MNKENFPTSHDVFYMQTESIFCIRFYVNISRTELADFEYITLSKIQKTHAFWTYIWRFWRIHFSKAYGTIFILTFSRISANRKYDFVIVNTSLRGTLFPCNLFVTQVAVTKTIRLLRSTYSYYILFTP